MALESGAVCPACNGEVLPGTLFCWQHVGDAPRLAEYKHEAGQLLWVAAKCKMPAERAVAVVVDGRQVAVRDVVEQLDQRPAALSIYYSDPGAPSDAENSLAIVSLAALLEGFVAGMESVDAIRSSAAA